MRRARWSDWALAGALALGGCDRIEPPAPARCAAVAGEATPTAAQVCARLNALDCRLESCAAAYASYESRVSPAEFNRLASCYVHAASCDEVGQCELACGADGGAVTVGQARDASAAADADDGAVADAGGDAGTDIGTDVGTDVGNDTGTDVGTDVGTDIGTDVGTDIGNDTGTDIGTDVGTDVPTIEAGTDAAGATD